MSKDSKRNYHEDENAMVQNMDDLEALEKKWNRFLKKMMKINIIKHMIQKRVQI